MSRVFVAVLAPAFALLAAGTVSVASAAETNASSCSQREAIKSVFPAAKTVGFSHRGPIKFQEPRAPVWPGRCVGWWTEYQHFADGKQVDYVDAGITLYRTHAQALFALREPAFGSVRVLSNGARVRVSADGSGVVSVIRNVMISSTSSYASAGSGGVPELPLSTLMKIHRRIQSAVLRLV